MKLLTFLFLLLPFALKAEEIKLYKATNDIIYHVGDTVRLGRGSSYDGTFQYVNLGGFIAFQFKDPRRDKKQLNAPETFASNSGIIKKIKMQRGGPDANRVTFVTDFKGPVNYNLYIEDAIATCEVTPCPKTGQVTSQGDKFDQLKKLKALFDSGALTKEEYETEKKKLLN